MVAKLLKKELKIVAEKDWVRTEKLISASIEKSSELTMTNKMEEMGEELLKRLIFHFTAQHLYKMVDTKVHDSLERAEKKLTILFEKRLADMHRQLPNVIVKINSYGAIYQVYARDIYKIIPIDAVRSHFGLLDERGTKGKAVILIGMRTGETVYEAYETLEERDLRLKDLNKQIFDGGFKSR
jgi:hypothetical protein